MNSTQTREHPAADTKPLDIPDFLLMPLIEAAFSVVKKEEESSIPTSLRRISHFDSKALSHATARTQIIQSILTHAEFAQRVEEEFFARVEVGIAYSQWSIDSAHDIVAQAATRNDLPLIASILWLKKPDGYEFGLGLIIAYSAVVVLENEQRESQRAVQTRITHAENSHEKEKNRADLLAADVERLEKELREERTSRRAREMRHEKQLSTLQTQVDQNDEVVERLKDGQERHQQRVEREASRAHELESRLRVAQEEAHNKGEKITQLQEQLASALSSDIELTYEDLQKLIVAQNEAESIAKTILSVMNKTRTILSNDTVGSQKIASIPTAPTPVARTERVTSGTTPRSRTAVVVPPGRMLESDEALRTVFTQQDLVVLIDGYNVSLNAFPDLSLELQRERTVACVTNIETRYHPACVVIFDGDSATTRGRVHSKVHVVFSPAGTSADDVIVDRIKMTPIEKPILVVTSDNNLRSRVKGLGCESISSSAFISCAK